MEGVRIVLCLRDTGMPLSEIRRYMELLQTGAEDDCNPIRRKGK